MSDLPQGWEWATLGDIAETSLGKMLDKGKTNLGHELVPYLRNVNIQWGRFDLSSILEMEIDPRRRDTFEVSAGDLLVCEGGEIGRCAIWPGSNSYIAFQKALHRIRPSRSIDSKYLRYTFEHLSLTGGLLPYSSGSTIKHLPQIQLRALRLPIPPVAEQQRIVAALESHLAHVDAGTSTLASVGPAADALQDQILAAAFSGPPSSPQGCPRLAPAGTNDGILPRIPTRWHWKRLGEIADTVGGITKDAKRQSDSRLREIPYLRVANVQRNRLDL